MEEYSLSFWTWFWLFVPMSIVVILSFISLLRGRDKQ